jgi:hypothetical protein
VTDGIVRGAAPDQIVRRDALPDDTKIGSGVVLPAAPTARNRREHGPAPVMPLQSPPGLVRQPGRPNVLSGARPSSGTKTAAGRTGTLERRPIVGEFDEEVRQCDDLHFG